MFHHSNPAVWGLVHEGYIHFLKPFADLHGLLERAFILCEYTIVLINRGEPVFQKLEVRVFRIPLLVEVRLFPSARMKFFRYQ